MANSFLPIFSWVLVLGQLFLPLFFLGMNSFLLRMICNYHFNTKDFQISIPAMTSPLYLSMYV